MPQEPPAEVPTTPAIVDQISRHIGDSITDEQVANVLAALNHVRGGDPVGAIRFDPKTRAVAHRVEIDGVIQWRVTTPDGATYNDLQPILVEWLPITPAS
jgi:hypothetical protein